MPSRVLVTGGAGYIGSILCEHLLQAVHHVTVLDNLLFGQESLLHLCYRPEFTFHQGDARDEATLKPLMAQADAILPLAAIVGAPACARDPHDAETVNLGAVRSLLRLR